jgi:hypothetical protein
MATYARSVMTTAAARRPLLRDAAIVAGLVFGAYLFLVSAGQKGSLAFDVVAYWSVDLARPYGGNVGDLGFFAYAPPFALVLAPFTTLPWLAFVGVWYALLIGAVVYLGRRDVLAVLAFPPVAVDLYHGNIHLLLALAIGLGLRHPAAWALVLLTKVTPGVGLLWFVVRREWRNLAVALGATAAIVAVTYVFLPTQWAGWIGMLLDNAGTPPPWPALPVPLWLRLPLAAAVVVWGARTDRAWAVPVAAAMALPALWPGGWAILAACWQLRRRQPDYHAPDVVRSGASAVTRAGLEHSARPA